jgi:hypothetical protein
MSTRNDYSADEWKLIAAAPAAAGLAITLSDRTRVVGSADGATVVGNAIARSALGDAPEIVKVLATRVKSQNGRADLPEMPVGSRTQTRDALIAIVRRAVRAVETISPAEVEPFKTWLASVAAKVFHSAEVARLAANGGSPITRNAQDTITRLAEVLGSRRGRGSLRAPDRPPTPSARMNRRPPSWPAACP